MNLFEEFKLYETMWNTAHIISEGSTKIDINQYFSSITASSANILKFIKEKLKVAIADLDNGITRHEIVQVYAKILLDETNCQASDVISSGRFGYKKFIAAALAHGLTRYYIEQALFGEDFIIDKLLAKFNNLDITVDNRPTLDQYFNEITSSKEAAIHFIKNTFIAVKSGGFRNTYSNKVAKATNTRANKVQEDTAHNYDAFVKAISSYGLNTKYIRSISNNFPIMNALDTFAEITASRESVESFIQKLSKQYADFTPSNPRQKCQFAYVKWFIASTDATTTNMFDLTPETVSWGSFVRVCEQKFNYSVRDINRLFNNN